MLLPFVLIGLGVLSKKAKDRAKAYQSEKMIESILSKVDLKVLKKEKK